MDDIDKAQELEQARRDLAIAAQNDKINKEREQLQLMEEKGILNTCRYCGAELDGYGSAFCPTEPDWSCQQEWMDEQRALESGRVRKV